MENVNNNPSLRGININITEGVFLSKEDFKLSKNDSRKSKLKLFVLLQRFLRVIRY
ncbi:13837_t:CDS:2 [Entrophospora sp. SA101]|nr:13837_t:CDS:2 [Entrophospora sp. SA101]